MINPSSRRRSGSGKYRPLVVDKHVSERVEYLGGSGGRCSGRWDNSRLLLLLLLMVLLDVDKQVFLELLLLSGRRDRAIVTACNLDRS